MKKKQVTRQQAIELIPDFVKDFFTDTGIEDLSNREIEELLRMPKTELKTMIGSFTASASTKSKPDSTSETKAKYKMKTQEELRAELIAELKAELGSKS